MSRAAFPSLRKCFRLTVDDGLDRNYLDPYEVTLTLASANLTWGKIAWDAFKGVKCDGKMFTPDVDVCEMLAEEVDMPADRSRSASRAASGAEPATRKCRERRCPNAGRLQPDVQGRRRQPASVHRDVVPRPEKNHATEPPNASRPIPDNMNLDIPTVNELLIWRLCYERTSARPATWFRHGDDAEPGTSGPRRRQPLGYVWVPTTGQGL